MGDSIGRPDTVYEFVELHNPAAQAVDVSGWRLGGASFTLPAGAAIPGGGFLVCCASQALVQARYGITNTVGDWIGVLRNGGETIRLVHPLGRQTDEVDYEDACPWPVAADGYGPSLERINLAGSGSNSYDWASSMADTNWIELAWTGVIGSAGADLSLFLDFDGKCWIDDVSLKQLGGGSELVPNGDFESGTNGWTAIGNHAQSRVEPGQGRGGGGALALAGTFSRFVLSGSSEDILITHGDAVSNAVKSLSLGNDGGSTYVLSLWVRRNGLGNQVSAVIGNESNGVSVATAGTPGESNSVHQATAAHGIVDVNHAFVFGPTGQPNRIEAEIEPAGAVSSVRLGYRTFGVTGYEFTDAHYSYLDMKDDGIAPDLVPGDSTYTAEIPAADTNQTFVRYHVEATGTNGVRVRKPGADNPVADYSAWIDSAPPQTQLPNWYLIVDGNPFVYPVAARACAATAEAETLVDATVRHRGNPLSDDESSGFALRVQRAQEIDTWFAKNERGINFRTRLNDDLFGYRRIVNEWLAYTLQSTMGFPTPRIRHVVVWINGTPSVTMLLEAPDNAFLTDWNISQSDYLSRTGWSGRRTVGGNDEIDNLSSVINRLEAVSVTNVNEEIRTNIVYESVRHSMALLSLTANGDQAFNWNMFQRRYESGGRWEQYPWDVDFGFNLGFTNLHPYYETPLHPGVFGGAGDELGMQLFFPESGSDAIYTLPYRHRQQLSLWRYVHTLFTTNWLYGRLDELLDKLTPAYVQIGETSELLTNKVNEVRQFIPERRDFFMSGSWSDRDPSIWTSVYGATSVVLNELMIDPASGGEYLELFNYGPGTIDLSAWHLSSGDESYRIPYGTILAPTSYLVVADMQVALTNAFIELSDAGQMIERYTGYELWDFPLVFTSAAEHASRIVQLSKLTLANTGATVALYDLCSNLIDSVTYSNAAPWPDAAGVALELVHFSSNNQSAANWRQSSVVGTPGSVNSGTLDMDADTLPDIWEQQIVDASGGGLGGPGDVHAGDDFDMDGLSNGAEFELGTDPTSNDLTVARMVIRDAFPGVTIEMQTFVATGEAYQHYGPRTYTFEETSSNGLPAAGWTNIPGYRDVEGTDGLLVYTNPSPFGAEYYRGLIKLLPLRP